MDCTIMQLLSSLQIDLAFYRTIKIFKELSQMINFEEFEVYHPNRLQEDQSLSPPLHELFSLDRSPSLLQTDHSIHESNIEEIQDIYSSIEHSENILDHMNIQQKILSDSNGTPSSLQDEQNDEQNELKKRLERRLKNETKNIPKNFGKGIISFIEKNHNKIRGLLSQHGIFFHEFMSRMRQQKKTINTIADLRTLWIDHQIGGCLRIISNMFFRRYALHYIFNSRICNFKSHIKYRQSLWEALKNPQSFNRIKEY